MTNLGSSFNAPWGWPLKVTTFIASLILLGVSAIGLFSGPEGNVWWITFMAIAPLVMLLVCSLFTIRGYVLDGETLLVQRLLWATTVDLNGLKSAHVDPEAMTKSLRTFGNGGLFCIAGQFSNEKLGGYRALATNTKLAVVLRFRDRTVVITPDCPDGFVKSITEKMKRHGDQIR